MRKPISQELRALGQELRALRTSARVTQIELGRRVGCSHAFICQIETGARPVPPRRAVAIRRALRAA